MKRDCVRLAITGATGFIGRGILENADPNLKYHAISRSRQPSWVPDAVGWSTISSYGDRDALGHAIDGAHYVVHLADNPFRSGHRDQADAVRNAEALAYAARSSKVKGVILVSSLYARGEMGAALPSYGATKRLIENQFLSEVGLRTIVLRLPPVYGPGGKGGVNMLARLVSKRLPLPLGYAVAPRAYISRRNLVSLVSAIALMGEGRWEAAAGNIFEPSDGVRFGTRDLVNAIAAQLCVNPILLPFPIGILRPLSFVIGKGDLVSGATDELCVLPVDDLDAAFGWRPIETIPESLGFLRSGVNSS